IVRLVLDLVDRLNVVREGFELGPIDSLTPAYGTLTAGLLPEPWYPEALRTPGHRYYRTPDGPGEPLDAEIADLPADAPLVLMSFGSNLRTLLSAESELLPIAVEALGALPIRAVAAIGDDAASWRGPRPANVHLVPYVQ